MKRLLIVALGVVVLTAGCVCARQHRFVQVQNSCFSDPSEDPVPGVAGEKRPWPSLDCRHTLYTVGFVEFDDDGRTVDPLQEAKTLKLIDEARERAPGGKIIAVVYVHGWKNNASEAPIGGKPKDVEKFKAALVELGHRSRVAAGDSPPIPVVGVYLAWRGKSLMGPGWFNFLSFWGRRNSANRVGEGDAFASSLRHVIDKVNEKVGGVDTGSRVLLVGHSFGARVLEHAIETRDIPLHRPLDGASVVEPIVDLVLYVNSANDARLTMTRLQALRANPIEVRHPDYDPETCAAQDANTPLCRDYPLLVAITSRNDLATKYLLPAANTLNLDKSVPIPPAPPGTFLDRTPSPAAFRRAAAAHMKFLQSHDVREIACPPRPQVGRSSLDEAAREAALRPSCRAADSQCRFVFRTQGERPACFQVEQRAELKTAGTPSLRPFNTTPFWIMDVDEVVIRDHGDVWNLSFVEMLGQLMAPRGFFEPAAGRVQLRAPGR